MKKLHVFDLDKTLLSTNSSVAFGAFLRKNGLISFRQKLTALLAFAKLKLFLITPKELHEKLFHKVFRGQCSNEMTSFVAPFIDQLLPGAIRSSLLSILEQAKAMKDEILLLSNSPDFLVAAIAKHLGIPHWRATEYQKDGLFRWHSINHMMEGVMKARVAQEFMKTLSYQDIKMVAYTDSIDDLPLLEIATEKIAVAPDKILRSIAKTRGWQIVES